MRHANNGNLPVFGAPSDELRARPKVMFISRKWPPAVGGMESYSKSLADSLAKYCELELLVLPGRPDGRPPKLGAYAIFLLKAMWRVLCHARRHEHLILGDIVLFPAGLVAAATAAKCSRTVILYGLDLVYQRREGLLPRIYGLFLKAFVSVQAKFQHKVAISAHTRSLAHAAGLRDVSVVVPAIPDSTLVNSGPADELLPDAFIAAPRRILYFGRLVHRKGADWFATRVLPHLPDDVTLFVVGSATDPAYAKTVSGRPRVQYMGRLPDDVLSAMIIRAHVVVMPNVNSAADADAEGFGLVAVEASALGAILVASRLQGITDAVIDGQTGTLVSAEDAPAWIEAVTSLLEESEDIRLERRRIAYTTSREAYSLERLGQAFFNLLELGSTATPHTDSTQRP